MKNLKSINVVLLCFSIILMISCKKNSEEGLSVIINSPIEGNTYTGAVEMGFSINAPNGLDSCSIALTNAAESSAYYLNNFATGSGVRNKTAFTYSYTQTTLPTTLTDAKFIITVVDLQKKRFTKTINLKIIQ